MFKSLLALISRVFSRKKTSEDPKATENSPPIKEALKEPEIVSKENTPKEPVKESVPMESNFDKSLELILKFEGGYVNDPDDHGGATNKGVIQKRYDEYRDSIGSPRQSVEFISDAEVKDIYYKYYWLAAKCDQLPDGLDTLHFDAAVNAGPTQAAKFLQRALGVPDDGIIGDKTIGAAKNANPSLIKKDYVTKRADFYVDLVLKDNTQLKFLKGWIRRTLFFV